MKKSHSGIDLTGLRAEDRSNRSTSLTNLSSHKSDSSDREPSSDAPAESPSAELADHGAFVTCGGTGELAGTAPGCVH